MSHACHMHDSDVACMWHIMHACRGAQPHARRDELFAEPAKAANAMRVMMDTISCDTSSCMHVAACMSRHTTPGPPRTQPSTALSAMRVALMTDTDDLWCGGNGDGTEPINDTMIVGWTYDTWDWGKATNANHRWAPGLLMGGGRGATNHAWTIPPSLRDCAHSGVDCWHSTHRRHVPRNQ